MTDPLEPTTSDFATATITVESQTQRRQQGRPATFSTTSAADDIVTVADLSGEGQKIFQLAWSIYTHRIKQYADQKANIKELKTLGISSIASYYFESACEPTETIREWYL